MKRALIDRKMLDYRRYTSFLKERTGARFNARPGRRKYFGFWTVSPVDSVRT